MIIWGHSERDQCEDMGRFTCPQCDIECDFIPIRTWQYFHVYFVPVLKKGLLAERIRCNNCDGKFSITVLAGTGKEVPSAFETGASDAGSLADNFGNVVEVTETAANEIRRRAIAAQFEGDIVVRIQPDRVGLRRVLMTFDYPLADGRDWIGESCDVPLVVSRAVAPELEGCMIAYHDGEFVRK